MQLKLSKNGTDITFQFILHLFYRLCALTTDLKSFKFISIGSEHCLINTADINSKYIFVVSCVTLFCKRPAFYEIKRISS